MNKDVSEFLQEAKDSEVCSSEGTHYCKKREAHPVGDGFGHILWKLSPNGLTGFGFCPKESMYYEHICNPSFENDSHKAEIVQKFNFGNQLPYVWEVAHELVGHYEIASLDRIDFNGMERRACLRLEYAGSLDVKNLRAVDKVSCNLWSQSSEISQSVKYELFQEESISFIGVDLWDKPISRIWLIFGSIRQLSDFYHRVYDRMYDRFGYR